MKRLLPWMSRSDRARWRSARTLADFGRLSAAWLEGEIRSIPGHRPGRGPAADLTSHIGVLTAANRAGFCTIAAQVGFSDISQRGLRRQKTAVQGFARDPELIRRLVDAAEEAGLDIILADLLDADDGPGSGVTVTTGAEDEDIVFGYALGIRNLVAMWRGFPTAVNAFAPALQITLADPNYGPSSRLWEALAKATAPSAPPSPAPAVLCTACGCTALGYRTCGDGCEGVTDQSDGRCQACIAPGVLIDWTRNTDGDEFECALCGAPFHHGGSYCSPGCRAADHPSDDAGSAEELPERQALAAADDLPY
ncbi:DUF6919 domain-containing protein [Streptomyces sp. NPDC048331]|uniref:DUF6919 domain-containing protein n=1 Tax=Streptomyces sp. NPDC048331 TaxID=3365534 RepID=UPI003710165F